MSLFHRFRKDIQYMELNDVLQALTEEEISIQLKMVCLTPAQLCSPTQFT